MRRPTYPVSPPPTPCSDAPVSMLFLSWGVPASSEVTLSFSGRLLGWVGPCTHDPSPQTASQERGQLGYSTADGGEAGG